MGDPSTRLDRRRILALAGSAAMAALAAPALARGAPAVTTLAGRAFGTGWRIVLPAGAATAALRGQVAGLLAEIDAALSPWRSDSELSGFNAAQAGRRAVSPETARIAAAALEVARASGGAYDPTVGPLVARWGFGPIAGDPRPGWTGIAVAPDAIGKARAGLTLDLCGIAKGRALDRIVAHLAAAGQGGFLVDLGGELAARGRHPSGRRWRVGVEDPRPGRSGLAEVLALDGVAVATSGSRANGYTLGRRRYSHIIDPRTRAPVAGELASVSVVATDAMRADAWATACMAAGASGGPLLARRAGLAALFLIRDRAGLRRVVTGGFADHLA